MLKIWLSLKQMYKIFTKIMYSIDIHNVSFNLSKIELPFQMVTKFKLKNNICFIKFGYHANKFLMLII